MSHLGRATHPPRAWRGIGVAAVLALSLQGCTGPRLEVRVEPNDAQVYLDGRVQPPVRSFDLQYYGVTRIGARQGVDAAGPPRLDREAKVTVDEPFPAWLFPADLVLEVITFPFRTDHRLRQVDLRLPARESLDPGVPPPDLAGLRERARRAMRGL